MTMQSFVFLIIGTVLAVAFLAVSVMARKRYEQLIVNLKDDEHFFKSIYPVGFFVLDLVKFKYDDKLSKQRRRECEVLYGGLYAEYYLRLNYAQKVSVALFFLPLGFLLYPVMQSPLALLISVLGVVCAYLYYDMQITDEMSQREDEIARDLPDILSKLTLLVNAGMILTEAWERTSITGDSTLYREMQTVVVDRKNGKSEVDALIAFGNRCMSSEVKKFVSTLVQNLSKGNKELCEFLKKQSSMGWEEKKQYARQKGEAASSKLMIPIAGMMIGVLIMVVVPIFGNLGL